VELDTIDEVLDFAFTHDEHVIDDRHCPTHSGLIEASGITRGAVRSHQRTMLSTVAAAIH
jgi:hypothetical protein